jgi:D-alanine transaminase
MPKERVCISPNDRGFLFADGVYEVMRSYEGRLFQVEEHLRRLRRSLDAIRVVFDGLAGIGRIAQELLVRNGLTECDATVYVQVTRGACPRAHSFPCTPVMATVYMEATRFEPETGVLEPGVTAITVPDIRWGRVDIKSVALLPNVLARQAAVEHGVFEAIFVRDGVLTEGTRTNVLGVMNGTVLTHARTNLVLPGITRDCVLEVCGSLGIPVSETCIFEDQLAHLDELFLAGTTVEIAPVLRVNAITIGDGRPGAVTRRLQAAFREYVRKQ